MIHKWHPGMTWDYLKRWSLEEALERYGWNRRKAADALRISVRTVRSKVREWNLNEPLRMKEKKVREGKHK